MIYLISRQIIIYLFFNYLLINIYLNKYKLKKNGD